METEQLHSELEHAKREWRALALDVIKAAKEYTRILAEHVDGYTALIDLYTNRPKVGRTQEDLKKLLALIDRTNASDDAMAESARRLKGLRQPYTDAKDRMFDLFSKSISRDTLDVMTSGAELPDPILQLAGIDPQEVEALLEAGEELGRRATG